MTFCYFRVLTTLSISQQLYILVAMDIYKIAVEKRKKLLDIAGHMKDAWLHTLPLPNDGPCALHVPSDDRFLEMASYLMSIDIIDRHECAHMALRNSVDKALDMQDDAGNTLRSFQFTSTGPLVSLRDHLVAGMAESDRYMGGAHG